MTTIGDKLYQTFSPALEYFLKKHYNIEEEVNEVRNFDGPVFMIGNHVSFSDPLIATAYRGKLVRFLAADTNYDYAWKRVVFGIFHVIPFARARNDFKAVKRLKEIVKNGDSVGLYPEGVRNWDGATGEIIPSTAKLVKLLGVPVYSMKLQGFYMTKPRWARELRRGRTKIRITKLLSAEDIKRLDTEEILKVIQCELAYSEITWQRRTRVRFAGRNRAEYIEKILYKCPECGGFSTFRSEGNGFSCRECGKSYAVNEFGFIDGCAMFDNTEDWNRWQEASLDELVGKGFEFRSCGVPLSKVSGSKIRKFTADLQINNDSIVLHYKNGGMETIPLVKAQSCNTIFTNMVEFYVDSVKYRFTLTPAKHISLLLLRDLIKRLNH